MQTKIFSALGIVACLSLPSWADSKSGHAHDHGLVHHQIATESHHAQHLFDKGLSEAYGFNHPEAAQSFREAIEADPECAMCHWGLALVLGPNINAVMVPENHPEARRALDRARELAKSGPETEKAYIEALSERYGPQPLEDRSALDRAYAKAMRRVAMRFPDDLDAGTLYAEALMDTMPWNYWDENGDPRPGTEDFIGSLESVLRRQPEHPGANHLLIHAVEKVRPEIGEAAADRLQASKQATGHLVHMASHIYVRIGRYEDAVRVNQRAIEQDDAYLAEENNAGDYAVGYVPHNHHMLWAAATFDGRSALTRQAARSIVEKTDQSLMREPGLATLQHFMLTPLFDMVRFGRWEAILELDEPEADLIYPRAIRHYARGMAWTRQGELERARRELDALAALSRDPRMAELTVWDLNTMASLTAIAENVLRGEIAAAAGDYKVAIEHLGAAVAQQDALTYDEPPPWHFPVRQALGAVQLEAGKPAAAEATYREDLDTFPRNGWSLLGLSQALGAQGRAAEAKQARAEFEKAWELADVELESSRF